jgi:hypothetical protein
MQFDIDLDPSQWTSGDAEQIRRTIKRNGGITGEQIEQITGRSLTVAQSTALVAAGLTLSTAIVAGRAAGFVLAQATGFTGWRAACREMFGA